MIFPGANLRVSSLKYANAKNCDLRSAILAGADLEVRNLFLDKILQVKTRSNNTTFHVSAMQFIWK